MILRQGGIWRAIQGLGVKEYCLEKQVQKNIENNMETGAVERSIAGSERGPLTQTPKHHAMTTLCLQHGPDVWGLGLPKVV